MAATSNAFHLMSPYLRKTPFESAVMLADRVLSLCRSIDLSGREVRQHRLTKIDFIFMLYAVLFI